MTYIPEAVFEARAGGLWCTYKLGPGFDVEELVDRLGFGLLWEAVPDSDAGIVPAAAPGPVQLFSP